MRQEKEDDQLRYTRGVEIGIRLLVLRLEDALQNGSNTLKCIYHRQWCISPALLSKLQNDGFVQASNSSFNILKPSGNFTYHQV
jgi:hypothetical protein